MSELAARHCVALEGQPAMTDLEVATLLPSVSDWTCTAGAIERTFRFADYHRTMAFVNAVAWIAHREDHHPDIAFGYNHCTLRFNTHSVGGISLNDFICAAKVDALGA
jgi:4a-hydroxytetrahydrobiopterin dehydratase